MQKPSVKLLVLAAALGGIGVSVFTARQSIAQFAGGGSIVVESIQQDVRVAQPLDASITNTYVPVGMDPGAPRLSAEVTGLSAGPVVTTYSGTQTMALSSASLSALTGRLCTVGGQGKVGVSGTVTAIPVPAGTNMAGRTDILLNYPQQAGTGFVACHAGALDAGTNPLCALPDAGAQNEGWPLDEGGSATFEIGQAWVVYCRSCNTDGTTKAADNTGRVSIGYVQLDCDQN